MNKKLLRKCHRSAAVRPYIFIPLNASRRDAWEKHLKPLTHLSKHAFRSPKSIGLTVAPDPNDTRFFLINWLYLEFP